MWASTGTSVYGDGYSFRLLKSEDEHFAPLLSLHTQASIAHPAGLISAIGRADTFSGAYEQGQRFAYCIRQWQVVQNRKRALSQGYCLLG